MKYFFLLLLTLLTSNKRVQKTNIFFGDSITLGYQVTATTRWSYLYCVGTNTHEENHGAGGTTMTPGIPPRTPFDINNVPTNSSTYDKIFIAYGTNDIYSSGTINNYVTATNSAVDGIVTKGWAASSIVLVYTYSPDFSQATQIAWRNALRAVATAKGTRFIDFSSIFFPLSDPSIYFADGLHPNAAGHALMGQMAVDSLSQTSSFIIIKGHKAVVQ